jgi:branched-chain amino acid transport system substrate-binding protein
MRHWERRGMTMPRLRAASGRLAGIAVVTAAAVGLAACGGSSSSSSVSTTATTATAGAAAANTQASAGGGVDQASIKFAAAFTGGTPGKADPSLPPVTIGLINQQGGTPAFPEYLSTAKAAVSFINDHLSGVGGHPLKLDTCIVQSEEDGQRCAAQILGNKSIGITNWSLAVVGGATFYKAVAPKMPIVISVSASQFDDTTPNVWALDGGGRSVLNGMIQDARKKGYKNLALVGSGNPAGKDSYVTIVIPELKQYGIKYKVVYVSDTATTPDIAAALQAAGAATANAVILNLASAAGCISTYDALKQLAIKTPVITTTQCNADQFVQHVGGGGAPGWDMFGFGTNPREVDDPQATVFRNVMQAYGQQAIENVGFVTKSFGDILTITKWANGIGYAHLSPKAFEQQINRWTGPGFMLPGQFHCGANKTLIGVCGNAASGSTFAGGKWVSVGSFALSSY